jgi:membrane-associated phospholipid phosphatase
MMSKSQRSAFCLVAWALACVVFVSPARGQDNPSGADSLDVKTKKVEPHPPPPTRVFHDLGSDYWHLFTSLENWMVLAGGGGLALAVSADDQTITHDLQDNSTLRAASKPGAVIGNGLVQFGIGVGVYTFGAVADNHKVAHIGWDLLRGQIVGQSITQITKSLVTKERPDSSNARSFPSGHASAVFTTASILHQHFGWKVGLPAYSVASYVALSRLPSNRHYLSDAIFGSALGIAVGRSVTYHERHLPQTIAIEPYLQPNGMGLAVQIGLGKPETQPQRNADSDPPEHDLR